MLHSLIAALVLASQGGYQPNGPRIEFTMASGKSFVVTTDPANSPKTVAHILDLVKRGFYDRQRIHRVEYWVTQWGDPASRTMEPFLVKDDHGKRVLNPRLGDGESGRQLPFEISDVDFHRGVVGIASTGLQVGGDSQLFVIKQDRLYLYHSYAVLGKVTRGIDVVDAIQIGDRIQRARRR